MNTTFSPFGQPLALTTKERQQHGGIAGIIDAVARNDRERLKFCRTVSDAVAGGLGRSTMSEHSFFVPADLLQTRTLVAGTPSAGGYAIDTTNALFADTLYATSLIGRLPVTRISATGNVQIPKSTPADAAWLANELAEATPADPTLAQIVASPKTLSTVTRMSRQLWLQSADGGRQMIEQQLARQVAVAVDKAMMNGAGGAEPVGILNAAGVTSVSGTSMNWATVVDTIATAEGRDAGPVAFVLGTGAAAIFKKRERAAGSGFIYDGATIGNVPVVVSAAAPTASMVIAPWNTVVVVNFGGLELTVVNNESSTRFLAGTMSIRCMLSVDIVYPHVASITKATTVT